MHRLTNVVSYLLQWCPNPAAMAEQLVHSRALTRITALVTRRDPRLVPSALHVLWQTMELVPPAAVQRVVVTGVVPHIVALADPPLSPTSVDVVKLAVFAIRTLARRGDQAARAALRRAGAVEALAQLRALRMVDDEAETLALLNAK